MSDSLNFEPYWEGSQLVLVARYGSKPAREAGRAKGSIDDGIGFLGDIFLEKEIELQGGFFGMSKKKIPVRGEGFGKQLLARFEQEMGMKGAVVIQGNLVAESPDQLEWLIGWYVGQGYEFRQGETVGEWSPPDTVGIVSKALPSSACAGGDSREDTGDAEGSG